MKPPIPAAVPFSSILLACVAIIACPSCEAYKNRHDTPYEQSLKLEERNQKYDQKIEKRKMRRDARDVRYQTWWDAMMN